MKNKIVGLFCFIALFSCAQEKKAGSGLNFNPDKYEIQTLTYNGKEIRVRAFEKIVYVEKPVDTTYQVLNFYVPEEYYRNKSINGYNAQNAPIFFPNQVGGYMPAEPGSTKANSFRPPINGGVANDNNQQRPQGGMPGGFEDKKENTILKALSHGYIVASAGARGRTNKNKDGKYYGKAPAGLVDLKAAIRYLKLNDREMPGDASKIISNGTSAGGAMSALLGATGDNPDYLPYLKEIGAAETSDAIYASSDYCPITNLDHADAAYEWQFFGVNDFKKGGPFGPQAGAATETLNQRQQQVSADLKNAFPAYVNSLKLKDEKGTLLTLDNSGNGSFKEFLKKTVIASANKALKAGTDLSQRTFLTIKNGTVTGINWEGYVRYMQRQKTPPAFDALDLSAAENIEFGTEIINAQHFTGYSLKNSTVTNTVIADKQIVRMMNPMNYIGDARTKTAKYWRIRHGSKDKDTGLAISAILATRLTNKGYHVDYALPWDKPHSGDYDLDELFQWIDQISK
jgi:hypothetical protein